MPLTRRRLEDDRTEAFLLAIRTSSPVLDPHPPTVAIPVIVTTAPEGPEPAVLEHRGALSLLALVGMLVVLAACLGGALMDLAAGEPATPPAHSVVDLTSDTTVDYGARGGTR